MTPSYIAPLQLIKIKDIILIIWMGFFSSIYLIVVWEYINRILSFRNNYITLHYTNNHITSLTRRQFKKKTKKNYRWYMFTRCPLTVDMPLKLVTLYWLIIRMRFLDNILPPFKVCFQRSKGQRPWVASYGCGAKDNSLDIAYSKFRRQHILMAFMVFQQ